MESAPFVVGTIPWRVEQGAFRLTVVVKATFALVDGGVATPIEPQPLADDVHHDGDASKSLAVASDRALRKTRADVLFRGHFHAGIGERVTRGRARLALHDAHGALFDKSIEVVGERRRNPITNALGPIEPFARVPLQYELAFGGAGYLRNPVGCGVAKKDRLPRLVDPVDQRNTLNFGPIAPTWSPRASGKAALDAAKKDPTLDDVPKDFSFEFFNAAPRDQQVRALTGHEELRWSGLHPTVRELRTRLPGLAAKASIEVEGAAPIAVRLVADTLFVEGDELRASISWRGDVEVSEEIARGKQPFRVVAALGPGREEIVEERTDDEASVVVDAEERPSFVVAQVGKMHREVFLAIAAVGWADGTLDADEADGIVSAALESGLDVDEIAEIEAATKTRVELGALDASKLSPLERAIAYATAYWIATLDGVIAPGERVTLEKLGDLLELPHPLRAQISAAVVEVAQLPSGDRPDRYDLARLRERLAFFFVSVTADRAARPSSGGVTKTQYDVASPREASSSTKTPLASTQVAVKPRAALADTPAPTPPVPPPAPPAPTTSHDAPRPAPVHLKETAMSDVVFAFPDVAAPPPIAAPIEPPRGDAQRPPTAPAMLTPMATEEETRAEEAPIATPAVDETPTLDGDFDPPPRRAEPLPIVNVTRLAVCSFPFQIRPPGEARVVVVKATLSFGAEGVTLARDQLFPSGDEHWDDDPSASLRYASDFVPYKPKADVLLVGHAMAGTRGNLGVVTLRFGALSRRIAVFGDRSWRRGETTEPRYFDRMPLRWERALGGPLSKQNPVGVGYQTGVLLPNLEDPDALVRRAGATPPPACLAPIAPTWPQRMSKLGTYDSRWVKTRWPYLPEDVDMACFNAAAPSQQLDEVSGDERFTLAGFGPDPIEGKLPSIRPRVFALQTAEAGGRMFEVLLKLDTVWFDVDASTIVLVWRGKFDARDEEAPEISRLFVTQDRGAPMTVADARGQLHAALAAERRVAPQDAPDAPANEVEVKAAAAAIAEKLKEQRAIRRPAPAGKAKPVDFTKRFGFSEIKTPPTPERAALLERLRSKASLDGADFTGVDLSGANLVGMDLRGIVLKRANLRDALLDGCALDGAQLTEVDAEGASLRAAVLSGADLTRAKLTRAKLGKAILQRTVLDGATCVAADFAGCEAMGAAFTRASLVNASFEGAKLASADLTGATLDGATFANAELPAARLYDATGADVSFEGATLTKLRADGAHLARCDFRAAKADASLWEGATLEGSTFDSATLVGALFVRARLDGAILNRSDCTEARFRRASLHAISALKTNFKQASFERADLSGADLRGANLYQAETLKTNLDGARMEMALIAGTKLARS